MGMGIVEQTGYGCGRVGYSLGLGHPLVCGFGFSGMIIFCPSSRYPRCLLSLSCLLFALGLCLSRLFTVTGAFL